MILPAKTSMFSAQKITASIVTAAFILIVYFYALSPVPFHEYVNTLRPGQETETTSGYSQQSYFQQSYSEKSLKASEASSSQQPSSQEASIHRPSPHWQGWGNIKHLVGFGDSISSTHFKVYGNQPSRWNPLGNPQFPGITTANGPNWLGFLTATYNETFVKTVNLAYSGATVDNDIVPAMSSGTKSFKDQVTKQWMEIYVPPQWSFDWRSEDTLFATFLGNNDVRDAYLTDNVNELGRSIDRYMDLLHTMYQAGARNFLVLNVLPFDRAPLANSGEAGVVETIGRLIIQYNEDLARAVSNFGDNHLDASVFVFDTHTLFNKLLDDPCSHEQTCPLEVLDAYCDAYKAEKHDPYLFVPECKVSADKYFWLSTVHACFRVHNVLAESIVDFLGISP